MRKCLVAQVALGGVSAPTRQGSAVRTRHRPRRKTPGVEISASASAELVRLERRAKNKQDPTSNEVCLEFWKGLSAKSDKPNPDGGPPAY